jgi:hypothetical protein
MDNEQLNQKAPIVITKEPKDMTMEELEQLALLPASLYPVTFGRALRRLLDDIKTVEQERDALKAKAERWEKESEATKFLYSQYRGEARREFDEYESRIAQARKDALDAVIALFEESEFRTAHCVQCGRTGSLSWRNVYAVIDAIRALAAKDPEGK